MLIFSSLLIWSVFQDLISGSQGHAVVLVVPKCDEASCYQKCYYQDDLILKEKQPGVCSSKNITGLHYAERQQCNAGDICYTFTPPVYCVPNRDSLVTPTTAPDPIAPTIRIPPKYYNPVCPYVDCEKTFRVLGIVFPDDEEVCNTDCDCTNGKLCCSDPCLKYSICKIPIENPTCYHLHTTATLPTSAPRHRPPIRRRPTTTRSTTTTTLPTTPWNIPLWTTPTPRAVCQGDELNMCCSCPDFTDNSIRQVNRQQNCTSNSDCPNYQLCCSYPTTLTEYCMDPICERKQSPLVDYLP